MLSLISLYLIYRHGLLLKHNSPASLASQLALQISCLILPSAGISHGPRQLPSFCVVAGIQILVVTLVQQALGPLRHLPILETGGSHLTIISSGCFSLSMQVVFLAS